MSVEYIGDYRQSFVDESSLLDISICPQDVHNYWNRCGLISNFSSYYISMAFPQHKSIVNSLSMILNELLENAVKYSVYDREPINMAVRIVDGEIIVEASNSINKEEYDRIESLVSELTDNEIVNQKYFEMLKDNALSHHKSGIGLFTIINYFNVHLSFKIAAHSSDELMTLTIQVKIDIDNL